MLIIQSVLKICRTIYSYILILHKFIFEGQYSIFQVCVCARVLLEMCVEERQTEREIERYVIHCASTCKLSEAIIERMYLCEEH